MTNFQFTFLIGFIAACFCSVFLFQAQQVDRTAGYWIRFAAASFIIIWNAGLAIAGAYIAKALS